MKKTACHYRVIFKQDRWRVQRRCFWFWETLNGFDDRDDAIKRAVELEKEFRENAAKEKEEPIYIDDEYVVEKMK